MADDLKRMEGMERREQWSWDGAVCIWMDKVLYLAGTLGGRRLGGYDGGTMHFVRVLAIFGQNQQHCCTLGSVK